MKINCGFFVDRPPRFDFIFLSLGEDGHTASLLPNYEALNEQVRWTAVTRRPDEEFSRVTADRALSQSGSGGGVSGGWP